MWRRVSSDLAPWRRALSRRPALALALAPAAAAATSLHSSTSSPSAIHKTPPLFTNAAACVSSVKRSVEDVMPIATGLEREEIQAELEGRKRFDMDAPVGPFGTKEKERVNEIVLKAMG